MTDHRPTSVCNAAQRIVVVTSGGENPQVIINALVARFGAITVLREQPESKRLFLRRRMRKLGMGTACGQFATMIVSKFGKRFTRARSRDILASHGASAAENPAARIVDVDSINSLQAHEAIAALTPDVVLLVSCRMLSKATLAAIPCPVLNFHAGINPHYRGLMGGYWARIHRDVENFGATVHLVDEGVDTGDVLYQSRMKPAPGDTMHTYALLQTAASTDIVIRAIEDALSGTLKPVTVSGPSRQWFHPPIWTWLFHGITRGIW